MSFIRRSHEEARELGLVPITEREALANSHRVVYSWRPLSEVWSLRYGGAIPVILSVIPGFLLTNKIRNLHRLQGIVSGRISTVIPAILAPAAVAVTNQYFITDDILLTKTQCPVCLEIRSVSMQLFGGVLLPTAISIIGNYTYLQTLSVRLPDLNTKEFLVWVSNMLKKSSRIIYACSFLQVVVASALVYKQRDQWHDISAKLIQEQHDKVPPRSAMLGGY